MENFQFINSHISNNKDFYSVLGAWALAYYTFRFMNSIYRGLKLYVFSKEPNFKEYGQWAVITGATDGIGKAYAFELAKRGLNIVLVSRSAEKLTDVSGEIEKASSVKVKTLAIDFSGGLEIYDTVKKGLEGLDIGVLVNNVGMGYGFPEFFGSLQSDKVVMDIINVNMTSATMMTRIVLPKMEQKRKGIIVNISSGSGIDPVPLLTQYSATKAYLDFFSRALQVEYKSKGIIVQSVMPFFVATKLSKIRKSSLFVPSPTTFVRQALSTIGTDAQVCGYYTHGLQACLMAWFPQRLVDKVGMSQLLAVRKKALQRLEKAQ